MQTPAPRFLALITAALFTLTASASFAASPSAPAVKAVHPAPAAKSAPATGANDDDMPAEQVFKNIKVLRGMRAGDVDATMSYFSASLGVGCNHCHVQGPTNHLAPEVDESPRKQTARRMIAMTRALNEKYFDGKQIVLCATCHAGHPKPTRIPPTDQAALRLSNEAPGVGGVPLPAPEAVLAKYKQAAGGAAKIAAVSSEYVKLKQTRADGSVVTQEIWRQAPDRILVVSTGPKGVRLRGWNGKAGWFKNEHGQGELEADEIVALKQAAPPLGDYRIGERNSGLITVAREKFEGREVVVLEADDSRNDAERFYFDTESGLLVRHTSENFMGFGPVAEETRYDHYEPVDGLMRPRSQRVSGLWLTATEQYETFQLNLIIPSGKFDPPPPAPLTKH